MPPIFEKELKEIARIIAGIARHSEENDPALDKQLEACQEIFDDFSKKYPKIDIVTKKTIDDIEIKIIIDEPSVKAVFDNTASKIQGLTGVGIHGFDEATVQESDKFAEIVNKISDAALLTYTKDTGVETIVLKKYGEKVELLFEIKSIISPLTPQFQLLQIYSADGDDKINILNKCYTLGFVDIEDAALFEWEDEFYPKMLE